MLEQISVVSQSVAWRNEVAAEFPSVFADIAPEARREPLIARSQWDDPAFDAWTFDCTIDELGTGPLTLTLLDDGDARPGFPLEVLNRCQRIVDRRNEQSCGQLFDRVKGAHRRLHDLSRPLVRADYNHSIDVWQWLLRLEPRASLPVQLAALFHDIERLVSEPDRRIEHLARDYQVFKNAHAATGAAMAERILTECAVPVAVRTRAASIIAVHEEQSEDPEVALLNDADALSFFSLNSDGYSKYFGADQTRRKVAYTLNRMRSATRAKLRHVRLQPEIATMVNEG